MTWTAYQVVFKLKSPMHIGCGKVGNVQRTRPYVTGRVFWGALTTRLTRQHYQPATHSELYQEIGGEVHQCLKFTYFYPAIEKTESNQSGKSQDNQLNYEIIFPWGNEGQFRRRFLGSYTSTALTYPQQAADEGLLHEVEFVSPRTMDDAKQVYLISYAFEKKACNLAWQETLCKLQLGGERGYGWGDVQCVEIGEVTSSYLFSPNDSKEYCWQVHNNHVLIQASENSRLLAHTTTADVSAQGEIEPLVGREWKMSNQAGQHVEKVADPCWMPGSIVEKSHSFRIGNFGIWHLSESTNSSEGD